ncbi:RHS repeat-associated core domain-containing protein [Chryseobacterium sp. RU33C]|uniref:RHS repeat-associated core domain-containing protein n=1 Tax=Chryseobacterium sp. RU33C TaxID=1907398 RepID=UPI000956D115|nr:RHS repeat-associated core domain-containing protein [Chryseobacterium sp. RU33C]
MLEQRTGVYDNPYKFNAKELDRETGLYYYGARYYNPRASIWYGVDPLATYNPARETQFYGDGEHNGGVFYWGNLNPYIYTYQNPIKYIDPDGKQTTGYQQNGFDELEMGFAIQSYTWSFIGDARAGVLNLASRIAGKDQRYQGDGFFGYYEIPKAQSKTIAGDLLDVTIGLAASKFGVKGGLAQETAGSSASTGKSLVRFGQEAETTESLAKQAKAAEEAGFPHGISTMLKDKIKGSDLQHKSAPKSTVESFFKVVQTGKNPKHHTVVLPKPVTSKVTEQINEIFKPVPLEQIFKQNKK